MGTHQLAKWIIGADQKVANFVGQVWGAAQRRRVSRADAEQLALQLRSSRVPLDPDTSYWVGATAAAEILGVNVSRLNQLVAKERIPFEVHDDGRRIYRREQLRTVANAREARWH